MEIGYLGWDAINPAKSIRYAIRTIRDCPSLGDSVERAGF